MSFKNIPFKEIVSQDWEDSDFYNELTSKFIFMIFKPGVDEEDYAFDGFYLWNMSAGDLNKAKDVWERTKHQVMAEDFDNFPDSGFNGISHVRPKGRNSKDLMETSTGTLEKKKCFWLNSSYITRIINELQSKDDK